MKRLDLIIDTLDYVNKFTNLDVVEALAAARELRELKPVGEFVKAIHGNYPTMSWKEGYVAKIGDKFYALGDEK